MLRMSAISDEVSLVKTEEEPKEVKSSRLFSALLRLRDPPAAPEAASLYSRIASENSGPDQPAVMDRAQSGSGPLRESSLDEAGRKSWFNRLSGVYSVAERHIARGAKALQKLTVPASRLHDYEETKERVERAAAQLRGQDRLIAMKRWVTVLTEQELSRVAQPVIVAQPVSPSSSNRGGEEEDWQQLSALPVPSGNAAAERDGAPRASPVLFVDRSAGAEALEPMTFRELFLRSNALESIIAGYAQEGPSSQEEEELLSQLVGACLNSITEEDSDQLLGDLLALAGAQAQCNESSVPEQQTQAISKAVSEAITALKHQAEVGMLDRKMASLMDEIAEQAATAALLHKFNSGVSEPTGEVTHQRLMQGLAATKEVMQLVETLYKLASERSTLVADVLPPRHAELLDAMDQRRTVLKSAISDADMKIADNQNQRRDGEAFREQKLVEMGAHVAEVQEEIQSLQAERAALLAQLEKVELALSKAQARRADLEEGRNVFEEGNNFTFEALQHQADELSNLQLQYESEGVAVEKGRQLVSRAQYAYHQMQEEEMKKASKAVADACKEYSHAATRHLYFQRAQLQLLLRQLNFCASELSGNVAKQERVSSLGMDSLLPDVATQQHRLMQQYLDAEAACQAHLQQVAGVRESVRSVAAVAQASAALGAEGFLPHNSELEDLFKSVADLKRDLEVLKRPEGIPPQGEKLPVLQESVTPHLEEADSPASSPVPSATSSQGDSGAVQQTRHPPDPVVEASSSSQTSTRAVQGTPIRSVAAQISDLGLEDLLASMDVTEGSEAAETDPLVPGQEANTRAEGGGQSTHQQSSLPTAAHVSNNFTSVPGLAMGVLDREENALPET